MRQSNKNKYGDVKRKFDHSDEEMFEEMRDPRCDYFIKCDEFNLKGKTGYTYNAYRNEEITDYFEFNDKEGLTAKDAI